VTLTAAEDPTPELTSKLRDLTEVPLSQLASCAGAGELEDTLNRIAPQDGRRVLLVAAAFNSAI
jgi:FXSXX-COOH protein